MASLQPKQQMHVYHEDSTASLNFKLNRIRESTNLESENEKAKKDSESKKSEEDNLKTLKEFLSESLLYDPKLVY